jgi:hypothetical protein
MVYDNDAKTLNITSKYFDFMSDRYHILGENYAYTDENLKAKILNTMNDKSYLDRCMTLNSQKVDGENVVRFLLPDNCRLIDKELMYEYFEVSQSEFNKLLIN